MATIRNKKAMTIFTMGIKKSWCIILCLLLLIPISGLSEEKEKDHTLPALLVTTGVCGGLLVIGAIWRWNDVDYTGKWKMGGEGFFGENTYAGGADKFGHAYANYVEFRTLARMYELIGLRRENALRLSALAIFLLGTGVEAIDAFTSYGFAYDDVIANVCGLSLGYFCEMHPKVDSLIDFRLGYVPSSRYLRMEKGSNFARKYISLTNDYSGMTFFLDVKFAGMGKRISNSPLKYFLFGINYNTIDYSPRGDDKQRNLGLHIGLNVPVILIDIFGKDNKGVNISCVVFEYYALPFTNLLFQYDLNGGKTRLNFGISGRLQIEF